MKKQLKPEALYDRSNLEKNKIIPFQTAVVGTMVRYEDENRQFIVDLGRSWTGIIPEYELTIYQLTYTPKRTLPREAPLLMGTQIRAIVTEVDYSKKIVYLSRRLSMLEAWENIEEGEIVEAAVTNTIPSGIFLDVGNGIVAYNIKKDCCSVIISDIGLWFKTGDTHRVKILNKHDEDFKIESSLKLAYPGREKANELLNIGDIIDVKVSCNKAINGYFVQVNPAIAGIIDTREELQEGTIIKGQIRKITEKGLKLKPAL